jgi:hypothetical protein
MRCSSPNPDGFRPGGLVSSLLKQRFDLVERGVIEVRGKGAVRTWFLHGRRAG